MSSSVIRFEPQPILRCARVLALAAARGCAAPNTEELVEARDLATRLMDHEVAALEVYLAVQAVQPSAVLIFKQEGRVTGVFGALFLNETAGRRILERRFNALAPDPSLLTRDGEHPALVYGWGVAAETKLAGAAVLGAAADATRLLFPSITAFTRAVTPAGRHISLKRYGYRPVDGPDDDLLVKEPVRMEDVA
jgi:hypothetical protein